MSASEQDCSVGLHLDHILSGFQSYIKSIVGTTSLRNNENLYEYREVGQNAEALLRTMLVGKGRPGSCCAWKAP
jgi:hypothetical protein